MEKQSTGAFAPQQAQRDLNPTPEAVFAYFHWSREYAASGLGTMGFWDSLDGRQRDYCREAVAAICKAKR